MELLSLKCSNCGATIKCNPNDKIVTCEYCGTQHIQKKEIHNTVVEYKTCVIREQGYNTDSQLNIQIENLELLLDSGNYIVAEKTLKKLIENYPDDYRVWVCFIRLELSQFNFRYEDKSTTISEVDAFFINENASRRARQKILNRQVCNNDDVVSLETQHNDFLVFKNIKQQTQMMLAQSTVADAHKQDFSVIDKMIKQAMQTIEFLGNITAIGEFIVCKELLNNGRYGYSFCYFGEDLEIHLPIISDDKHIKLNRLYVSSKIDCYKVYVPEEIDEIGNSAFSNCENVQEIIFLTEQISISAKAFNSCIKLNCIRLFSKLNEVSANTFIGCPQLNRMVFNWDGKIIDKNDYKILNNLINNGDYYGTSGIKVFQINGIDNLPEEAFCGNNRLTQIRTCREGSIRVNNGDCILVLSDTVQAFNKKAFADCSLITNINILGTNIILANECFSNNGSVIECCIEASTIKICDNCFNGFNNGGQILLKANCNSISLSCNWKKGTKAKICIGE